MKQAKLLLFFAFLLLLSSFAYAESPVMAWSRNYTNGNIDDYLCGIAIDSERNIIVAGSSENAFNSTSSSDFFTIKYNENGTLLWAQNYTIGDGGSDEAFSVTADSQRNIIVAGYAGSAFNSSSNDDFFTVKYDENGTFLWTRNYTNGEYGGDAATGVAVDSQRNIIVAGYSISAFNSSSGSDFLMIKYDENGTLLWITNYTNGNNEETATGVAVDSQRNIIVAGQSYRAFNSTSSWDFLMIKYALSPDFNSVTYSPNSTTDISSGTVINVTANVTAPANASLSSVILQYKRTGDSAWSNASMASVNGNYSTALPHATPAAVWTIQVWGEDECRCRGHVKPDEHHD